MGNIWGMLYGRLLTAKAIQLKYHELLLSAHIANKLIAAYQTLENVGARVSYGNGSFDP